MLHGGQLSSFISQLVKIAFEILVMPFLLSDETPFILGSFLELSKLFFLILTVVSLAL